MESSEPDVASPDEEVTRRITPEQHLDDLESIKAAQAHIRHALLSLHAMDSRIRAAWGVGLTQMLVDEAGLRIEYERIRRARDHYSVVQLPDDERIDADLPPWLVTIDEIGRTLVTVTDEVDTPPGSGSTVDPTRWGRLSTRSRAWAVNDLVRHLVERTPDHAGGVRQRDLVDAANGEPVAWQRLQTLMQPERERQAVGTKPSTGRRFSIRGLDADESDRALRDVLRWTDDDGLDARTVGKRLGPQLGSDDISPDTVRHWRRKAKEMRAAGLI